MASATGSAEEAVRSYLLWLEDPSALRDESAIKKASAALEAASDPIDRLKAHAKLEALQEVDGEKYRAGFVASATEWAAANGVSVGSFSTLGVPNDVLAEAGFSVPSPKRGQRRGGGGRRTRVTPETVRASVPARGQFTVAQVIEASGASMATVRKVISEMTDEGIVVDLGPDKEHTGRGRSPLIYRRK